LSGVWYCPGDICAAAVSCGGGERQPDGRGVPAGFAVGGGAGSGRDPVAFGDEPGSFLLYRDFCRKQSLLFEGAWSDGGRIGSARGQLCAGAPRERTDGGEKTGNPSVGAGDVYVYRFSGAIGDHPAELPG